jgi:hypothetical protein
MTGVIRGARHSTADLRWSLATLLLLSACASGPTARPEASALTPERLYPLALGSAWSYDVDAGDGEAVLAITRVVEAGKGYAGVLGGEGVRRYELRPDGLYQTALDGYLLKAPITVNASWPAGRGVTARVAEMAVAVETAAGRFKDCVRVVEEGAASGAVVRTTYCPDVGPVEVESRIVLDHGTVQVIARLRGYRIGAEPGHSGAVKSK